MLALLCSCQLGTCLVQVQTATRPCCRCTCLLQLPLLPASDKVAQAAQADLIARAPVSPNELPSCCFFTVVNARHGGVTAMTASPDTKHLAGLLLFCWLVAVRSPRDHPLSAASSTCVACALLLGLGHRLLGCSFRGRLCTLCHHHPELLPEFTCQSYSAATLT
jgi:hypothetical protein